MKPPVMKPLRLEPRRVRKLCLAGAVAWLTGCGIQGAPLPPVRLTPQPLSDFSVAQRDRRLEVSYTVPSAAVDGQRLPVVTVEIIWATREGDLLRIGQRRKRKAAPGERLVDLLAPSLPLGTTLRVSGLVRATRRVSAMAPTAILTVQSPPPAPMDLQASRTPQGVSLSWKTVVLDCPAQDVVSEPAVCPSIAGYHVYRRSEGVKVSQRISGTAIEAPPFEDTTAPSKSKQCYSITSLLSIDPLIESPLSDERCAPPSPEAMGALSSAEEPGATTRPEAAPSSSPD
jgi:hypothetical protein